MSDDKNKKRDDITGDPKLDHEYDGIEELDNPLPQWWKDVFVLTVIFSIIYVAYYHFMDGPSLEDSLAKDLKENEVATLSAQAQGNSLSVDKLLAEVKKTDVINQGKQIFASKCLSCHGSQGEGGIGPNLVDDYWIHGNGKPEAIYKTIDQGVADKGMPPWGSMVKPEELVALTAFVYSIHGNKVNNPKAPQGNKIEN